MIYNLIENELSIPASILETVNLGKDDDASKFKIRITQSVGDSSKNHSVDVKVMVDGRKSDEFMIAFDGDYRVNMDVTNYQFKSKSNKNKRKDFDNYFEYVAGAINYSRKSVGNFIKGERKIGPVKNYEQMVQDRIDKYYNMSDEERKVYQDRALERV